MIGQVPGHSVRIGAHNVVAIDAEDHIRGAGRARREVRGDTPPSKKFHPVRGNMGDLNLGTLGNPREGHPTVLSCRQGHLEHQHRPSSVKVSAVLALALVAVTFAPFLALHFLAVPLALAVVLVQQALPK
jgi:hypothetical protein